MNTWSAEPFIPEKKMGKRKSTDQGKSTTKKSKTFSKTEAKVISKIAKKVVMKQAETKVGYALISGTVPQETIKSWNLIYQTGITQGLDAENSKIIGNKFDLVGIKFRGNLLNNNSGGLVNGDTLVTLAFVETEIYRTTTSLANDDVFPDYSILGGYPQRFDSSKVRVIGKHEVKLKNLLAGINDYCPVDFYVPYQRTCELTSNSAGIYDIRGKQIYLMMYASTPNGVAGTTTPAFHNGYIEIFYKDI